MSDYPLGMDGQGKPGGRVRVLSDTDGDGDYDASRIFADGLNFPNGILTWRDGVLVTAAPQILFLRDTDHDGDMDEREVFFDGFNEGNQQLRLNGLRWGLDGWVYCANGGHHAGHGVGTKVNSLRNGAVYEVGSRDFRFDPDTAFWNWSQDHRSSGEIAMPGGIGSAPKMRTRFGIMSSLIAT